MVLYGTAGLTVNAAGTTDVFSGTISNHSGGTGGLTVGSGTQVLTGTNTYTGPTTINGTGTTLQIGNGSSGGGSLSTSSTISIANGDTLQLCPSPSSGGWYFPNSLNGGGALAIGSPSGGAVVLPNANPDFSGVTNLNYGTLDVDNNSALGSSGTLAIGGGTTIDSTTSGGTIGSSTQLTLGGNFTYGGTDPLTFDGPVTYTGSNVQATVTRNTLTLGGQVTIGSDSGSLTVSGGGTLVLNSNTNNAGNGYGYGATIISSGTLAVGSAGALGGGTLTVNCGVFQATSTFALGQTCSVFLSGSSTIEVNSGCTLTATDGVGGGNLTLSGNSGGSGGSLVLAGTITYTGTTTIGAGTTLQFGNGSSGFSWNTQNCNKIVDNGTLNLWASNLTLQVNNPISGGGGLVVCGSSSGTVSLDPLTLSTYLGGTTVNDGQLIAEDAACADQRNRRQCERREE